MIGTEKKSLIPIESRRPLSLRSLCVCFHVRVLLSLSLSLLPLLSVGRKSSGPITEPRSLVGRGSFISSTSSPVDCGLGESKGLFVWLCLEALPTRKLGLCFKWCFFSRVGSCCLRASCAPDEDDERRRATFSFPFSRREFGGCEVEGFH